MTRRERFRDGMEDPGEELADGDEYDVEAAADGDEYEAAADGDEYEATADGDEYAAAADDEYEYGKYCACEQRHVNTSRRIILYMLMCGRLVPD